MISYLIQQTTFNIYNFRYKRDQPIRLPKRSTERLCILAKTSKHVVKFIVLISEQNSVQGNYLQILIIYILYTGENNRIFRSLARGQIQRQRKWLLASTDFGQMRRVCKFKRLRISFKSLYNFINKWVWWYSWRRKNISNLHPYY